MSIFKNQTHQDIWIDRWCHTCFQPDEAQRRIQGKNTQCPIQARALKPGRKTLPKEWERNSRNDTMEHSIKCTQYQPKPPDTRWRANLLTVDDVAALFDVDPQVISFVPVDGWPDQPRKGKDVDHA